MLITKQCISCSNDAEPDGSRCSNCRESNRLAAKRHRDLKRQMADRDNPIKNRDFNDSIRK